jgi:hypothetical protein
MIYLFVAVTSPSDIAANTKAAAQTARDEVRANPAIFRAGVDTVSYEEVETLEEFVSVFQMVNAIARGHQMEVRQVEVFSHGGLDGPIFGEKRRQFELNGAPALSTLPVLPYTNDAVVFFRGCRVGAGKFLEKFSGLQNVRTYGFEGNTSFSTVPRRFEAWKSGTPAYQLDFPGSETVSRLFGRHPEATPPRGFVPPRPPILQRHRDKHKPV